MHITVALHLRVKSIAVRHQHRALFLSWVALGIAGHALTIVDTRPKYALSQPRISGTGRDGTLNSGATRHKYSTPCQIHAINSNFIFLRARLRDFFRLRQRSFQDAQPPLSA